MEIELPNGQIVEFPDTMPKEQIETILQKQFPVTSTKSNKEDKGAFLDSLPDEEGFISKLPRNIAIGLAHAGRNLANAPHDIALGFEKATQGIGRAFEGLPYHEALAKNPKNISDYLPYDSQDYSGAFGQKGEGTLMDKLLQKGIEHAPEIASSGALLKAGLRQFPLTARMGSRRLREVEKFVNKEDIAVPITADTLEKSRQFLPKTHATNKLIEGSESGKYGHSFGLQSQIGRQERNLKSSPLASERLLAPEARELRQVVLKEIEIGLRNQGQHKAADEIREGINDYRKYIKIRENVYPMLKKIGIPTSILGLLGVGYETGKKVLKD